MVRRLHVIKIAVGVFVLVALVAAFGDSKPVNPLRIDAIAPAQDNFLLQPQQHIRLTQRPAETYSFPIPLNDVGPVNSLFSGANQYPFLCMTEKNGFGQPLVDNQQGYGMPVYPPELAKDSRHISKAIGFSKDCSINTQVKYFVLDNQEQYTEYTGQPLLTHQQLVRLEYGVINRFIYAIAMPITATEIDKRQAKSQWNNKLIYQFGGGAGIGFRQGTVRLKHIFGRLYQQLLDGYAVVTSSGNKTSFTYNMLLSEDTARRLKLHFVSLYGEPTYTIGIGGSGGGLAQYLIQQNAPGILDAAIPMYSYPDMVSQALYALDCDLLNNYYTFRATDSDSWQNMDKRQWLDGLVAKNGEAHRSAIFQPINQLLKGKWPNYPDGNSECVNGWFGLYAFIHNPKQGWLKDYFSEEVVDQQHWNHWQDLSNVYGSDELGFARHIWGNQGVQYGLNAVREGVMSIDEFIELNQQIGSWKPLHQMEAEKITWIPIWGKPFWLSLWGNHNITEADKQGAAKRHATDHLAVERGYRYGQIYLGQVDIPTLDLRHYLEDELDMHHVSASLQVRQRIEAWQGDTPHHVFWVYGKEHDPITEAFTLMDEWLMAMKAGKTMLAAKPERAIDACFDNQGQLLASGKGVWDGKWNQQVLGLCQQHYPVYSTSRVQAGGTWAGNTFDCVRIPVEQAIAQGFYGTLNVDRYFEQLKATFPDGVCDYSQGDQAAVTDLSSAIFTERYDSNPDVSLVNDKLAEGVVNTK